LFNDVNVEGKRLRISLEKKLVQEEKLAENEESGILV